MGCLRVESGSLAEEVVEDSPALVVVRGCLDRPGLVLSLGLRL